MQLIIVSSLEITTLEPKSYYTILLLGKGQVSALSLACCQECMQFK